MVELDAGVIISKLREQVDTLNYSNILLRAQLEEYVSRDTDEGNED